MAEFVETESRTVEGLTEEDVKYFREHSEEFEKAMDNAIEACEKDRESHKRLMEDWDKILVV